MKSLLKWRRISRQAVHQGLKRVEVRQRQLLQTLELADQVREDHPGMGCRDIYYAKAGQMPRGRDWSEQLLLDNGYRIKKPIRCFTVAGKNICSNLIEGLQITGPNQVWQTDITFKWVGGRWYYLSFIFDVYTRKVIHEHCSRDLSSQTQIQCIEGALRKVPPSQRKNLIIHTDRGVQYTAREYKQFLDRQGVKHSMAYYAWENAYCERFHRTIKHNYLKFYTLNNYEDLVRGVSKAVRMYNGYKPHINLPGRMSPDQFIQAQKEGKYAEYKVNVWSKLTSTKMLNVN